MEIAPFKGASDNVPVTAPLVSIVIPAYNHAESLDEAIQSVLAQDLPVELIVLDDGSTDNTSAVLTSYGNRFRHETHANIGQAATLNKGWAMAGGDILGYLSADDFLYPGAVRAAVSALSAQDVIVSYCDFDHVDPEGRRLRTVRRPEFSIEQMLTTLDCPPGPGAFFRRDAYAATGGWNPQLRQIPDFDFWLRMSRHGRFVHIPEVLAAWRVHPGSQSFALASPDRAEESVRVITDFFSTPGIAPQLVSLQPRSMARAHLYCAQLHGRAGRYRAALSNIVSAQQLYPGTLLQWQTWRSTANALLSRPLHRLLWRLRNGAGAKA